MVVLFSFSRFFPLLIASCLVTSSTVDATDMGCLSSKKTAAVRDVPPEVINDELNRLYEYFDKDGDGCITRDEIYAVLEHTNIHVTEKEADEIVKQFDTDGDGTLSRNEFQKMLAGYIKKRKDNLIRLFDHFDVDGDGFLSYSEFKRAMFFLGETLTMEDLRDLLDSTYRNPHDKISLDDFCRVVHRFV